MATKVTQDDLLEAIDGMTVLELSEFIKKFEERYGVTAAAPVAAAAAAAGAAGGAAPAAAAEEQTEFSAVADRGRPEQDPGHQGRARADRPRPQGGQGPRRRGAQAGQGRRRAATRPTRSRPLSRSRAPRSRSSNQDLHCRLAEPNRKRLAVGRASLLFGLSRPDDADSLAATMSDLPARAADVAARPRAAPPWSADPARGARHRRRDGDRRRALSRPQRADAVHRRRAARLPARSRRRLGVARCRSVAADVPRGLAVLIVYVVTVVVVIEALALLLGAARQPAARLRPRLSRACSRRSTRRSASSASCYRVARSARAGPPVHRRGASPDAGERSGASTSARCCPIARSMLGTAAGFFGFLIIPIWAFYILRDRVRLTDAVRRTRCPPSWRDEVWAVLSIIERVFGRWIRAQLLLGVIVGVGDLCRPGRAGLVDRPALHPVRGPARGHRRRSRAAADHRPDHLGDPDAARRADHRRPGHRGRSRVVVLYLVVQQVESAVLVPMIQGDAVQLHPSLVIFALIIGGSIAGLLGAILAIPITAAARDVYRYLFNRLGDDEESTSTASSRCRRPAATPLTAERPTVHEPPQPPIRAHRAPMTDGRCRNVHPARRGAARFAFP